MKIAAKSNYYVSTDFLKAVTVVWVLLVVKRLFHSVAQATFFGLREWSGNKEI